MQGNGNTITYRQQNSFCSKPGCRKCREGIGHGPYWYSYQAVNGRTVRTYIGKALPPGVQGEASAAAPVLADSTLSHTPTFRLFTLGQTRLERRASNGDWQLVTEPGWRGRSLLGCLICSPNRQLSQQQVCNLLWPSLDTKSATQQLRRVSTALSQALGQLYVKQTSNILALAGQEQLWTDYEAFEELLTQARALPPEASKADEAKSQRIVLLEQAIKLYGGDFLPEERAASWSQERRKGLRRQWISSLLDLVDLYMDRQKPTTAIELLDQLLATDPVNEAAVQRLMFILARQQRRVEAVQAYQRLTDLLRTTYQATSSPETQALFQAIQQGHEALFRPIFAEATPGLEGGSATALPGTKGAFQPTNPFSPVRYKEPTTGDLATYTGRANQSPLVGRDLELNSLYQLLAQVESLRGQPTDEAGSAQALLREARKTPRAHCVVLRGDAGIGKTRLAEESTREARRRGWTVIWSRAYLQEQGIPYRLWTAALRSVLTYIPDLARQVTEVAAASIYQPLRALVPEMQETLVGTGAKAMQEPINYETLSPEQEELRLRDAVYTFLTTLSFSAPLLIVLDDIQWIDDSSAQMLGYLARRVTENPIVLLATSRETELTENRVLHGLIAHMQREQVVEIIPVQPLSDEQIGALVSYLPTPAIQHVQSQAAGNPFFAEELAYSLQTNNSPDLPFAPRGQEETLVLPGTIAAALDQRLNRLSKECQDLLGKAAVLGGSFEFELIAAMETASATGDDDTVLDLLDEALHAGVLTEESGRTRVTYHFWHPLLASHMYNNLSATRRARLHRRVAEILPRVHQTHQSEEAATITQHLIKGGADQARIAHYAELAAQHAYNLFAYPEAERYYRIALNYLAPILLISTTRSINDQPLLPEIVDEPRRYLALLVERLGECSRIIGNFHDAPNFYLNALQLRTTPAPVFANQAAERQEAQIQAMIWSDIAAIRRYTGDMADAHQCYKRGAEVLSTAGVTDGPAWGSLLHQLACVYWQEGFLQEALQSALQALDLFTACLAQNAQTRVPVALQTRITRSLQGDPVDLGRSHNFLGICYTALGQLSQALKHLQQALAISKQYERRRESANVCCNTGHIHLLRGEYAEAHACFKQSLSYAEQSGDIPIQSVVICNLAAMAFDAQRLGEAEKLYREALALASQMNDREYLSTWHALLGETLQEAERFKEAAAAILRALAIGRTMLNQPCIGFALIALANLRMTIVEQTQETHTKRGQRALRHAQTDLQRALHQGGLDAEKRTLAHLALARVALLSNDFVQARIQGNQADTEAQNYELYVIQRRCQRLLAALPTT